MVEGRRIADVSEPVAVDVGGWFSEENGLLFEKEMASDLVWGYVEPVLGRSDVLFVDMLAVWE